MTPLKTGQRNNFMKNGFQIRIQHPRISFGANFQNFLTILRFSWKLRPTFWGAGPRPKQHVPPVSHLSCWKVQISGDPILSLGCITIPKEKFIPYPLHVQSGGGYFFKKVPPPLYRRCVWKTYTDEGLIHTVIFLEFSLFVRGALLLLNCFDCYTLKVFSLFWDV